jgi:ribosome biogenesis protein NSA1
MRLITGDECGLLKECIPELSRKEADPHAAVAAFGAMPDVTREGVKRIDPAEIQTRSRGIVDLTFTGTVDDQASFAALRQNGSIEFWGADIESRSGYGNYDKNISTENVFSDVEENSKISPLGLGCFQDKNRVCAADMLGNIAVVSMKTGKIVEQYNGYASSKRGKTISYTPGNNQNTQLAMAMACDPVHGRVAIGGRERETTLLDLSTGSVVFKAKNLPPDPQTLLQQPVWPTSILFLEGASTMAVGTGYKQVRLYDVREDSKMRRPNLTTPEGLFEYRVTSMCQVNEHRLVVGDAAGCIYDLDLRTLDRNQKRSDNSNVGRYVGPAGSVRQLKKHPSLPLIAAIGLDRMLRIYDTNQRKQLDCIYLKQRLNCVLFGSDDTWGIGEPDKITGAEGDYDIDQDDVVEDYVDSDDEAASSHKRDMPKDQMGDADGPSDDESDDSEVDSDDESLDQASGTSDSEEAPEASNDEVSESKEEESEDEEEEVIQISAKKQRRR